MSKLISILIESTGLTERDVMKIISNAPRRYKHFRIKKRNGSLRDIAQPARELKALQKVIVEKYLLELPVHQAAMAYRKGRSIRENALAHVDNGPILKMDFKEFFPSIRVRDWQAYCEDRSLFMDGDDLHHTSKILFHQSKGESYLKLAIGAPSSPHLSNLLMYKFDALVSQLVQKDYVAYTRYADDLTFSAKRTGYLTGVEKAVRRAIKEVPWPRLSINENKTVVATPRYHRQVTGLVLTNDQEVSLGRDRKRKISAAVHHAKHGELTVEAAARLSGTLAFVNSVEPEFLLRLERKYGREVIDNLKQFPWKLEK
ncbi:retron St85 family RNA-directed DNA polymerase [Stakelama marina]|uniref:RNA-directed DNA polymerase n=1 Tax=Stakelama marina TaxID=2826939 RepID=A0A8T4IF55_9SPHN|nr:retron St85 family RNA-directed DNA polymerase [Stakelama marina]MBR0553648.1 retron St85 family RNA-directed DNA polymerase [Stakelama marina]